MKLLDYNKHVLVMGSGGFDSTCLILNNLKQNNKVTVLYVNANIGEKQKELERAALRDICHYFSHKFNTLMDCWAKEVVVESHFSQGVCLQLPPLFTYAAFCFVNNKEVGTIDEIQFGYIMEDHALSYLSEIKQLYQSFNKFRYKADTEISPKIVFPIIKWSKDRCMSTIAEECPEIFHAISFCENPSETGERCYKCASCLKADNYRYDISEQNANLHLRSNNLQPYSFNDTREEFFKNPQLELFDKKELRHCKKTEETDQWPTICFQPAAEALD